MPFEVASIQHTTSKNLWLSSSSFKHARGGAKKSGTDAFLDFSGDPSGAARGFKGLVWFARRDLTKGEPGRSNACPEKGLDPDAGMDFLCRSNGGGQMPAEALPEHVRDNKLSADGFLRVDPDQFTRPVNSGCCFTLETAWAEL